MSFDRPLALPPGISQQVFENFLSRLAQAVGSADITVVRSKDQFPDGGYLEQPSSHDAFYVREKDTFIASAFVCPRSVDEVQHVVRAAADFGIPLWPTSLGRNLGYGGAAPRNMVMQNVPSLRYVLLDAGFSGHKSDYTSSKEPIDDAGVDAIAKKLNLGHWNFYGALYGPEEIRNAHWKLIKDAFSTIPGVKFFFPEDIKEFCVLHNRHKVLQGIPVYEELRWVDWLPNGAHIAFSPISKISGDDALRQFQHVKQRCKDAGFDYMGTFTVGLREMHHIVEVVFNRKDPDQRRRAEKLIRDLIAECAALGWGEYRTHLAFMDQIAETYNWNNNAQMRFNETIKNALDPKGILAPGKSGVWPSRFADLKSKL
ncbi:FAD-linked oxidase [Neofusicoccum parvum]|uniref:FAD-linked oxidase n=1 Tax=Neofusicoccum parvum TaxID=310453 RepID=A0ACB5SCS9_9PEZI|nr:FAD-linked oxidase [Neofusicoccum parvum]